MGFGLGGSDLILLTCHGHFDLAEAAVGILAAGVGLLVGAGFGLGPTLGPTWRAHVVGPVTDLGLLIEDQT